MAGGTAGRVICPRCGANNFDTQAACWKCGAALSGVAAGSPPSSFTPQPAPGTYNTPSPVMRDTSSSAVPLSYPVAPSTVDPAVAFWSAIALALLFPGVAIPIGLVFLMLDDRRKVELGRITLIWGIVFTFLHLFVTWLMIQGTVMTLREMLKMVPGMSRPAPTANLNDNAPPLQLPGIPNTIATPGPTSPFTPVTPSGLPIR